MRTAHMIVSAAAFAVWVAACVEYCMLADYGVTVAWYLCVPAAVVPPFWCLCAWFASRRADPKTSRWLMMLAVPVLLSGLGVAAFLAGEVARPRDIFESSRARLNVEGCCWPLAAPCGLISFVWAVALQVKSLFQPPREP